MCVRIVGKRRSWSAGEESALHVPSLNTKTQSPDAFTVGSERTDRERSANVVIGAKEDEDDDDDDDALSPPSLLFLASDAEPEGNDGL